MYSKMEKSFCNFFFAMQPIIYRNFQKVVHFVYANVLCTICLNLCIVVHLIQCIFLCTQICNFTPQCILYIAAHSLHSVATLHYVQDINRNEISKLQCFIQSIFTLWRTTCTQLQFIHCNVPCALYQKLYTVVQYVHCSAICKPLCNMYTIVQYVHSSEICTLQCNMYTVVQYVNRSAICTP